MLSEPQCLFPIRNDIHYRDEFKLCKAQSLSNCKKIKNKNKKSKSIDIILDISQYSLKGQNKTLKNYKS